MKPSKDSLFLEVVLASSPILVVFVPFAPPWPHGIALLRKAKLGVYRQGGPAGYGLRRQLIDENHSPKGELQRTRSNIQTDLVVLTLGPREEIDQVLRIYSMFVEHSFHPLRRTSQMEIVRRSLTIYRPRGLIADSGQRLPSCRSYVGCSVRLHRQCQSRALTIENELQLIPTWRTLFYCPK